MDNPEGKVTYPIEDRTAGLPTGSGTPIKCTLRFYLCISIKRVHSIDRTLVE